MSQYKDILNHLQSGKKLTRLDALNLFDCINLPARVHEMNNNGHNVVGDMIKVGKKKKEVKLYEIK
tara:strand:+ start:457 stop:654 length:198 start_codon:yes stop_codon:yes gene_type:complete